MSDTAPTDLSAAVRAAWGEERAVELRHEEQLVATVEEMLATQSPARASVSQDLLQEIRAAFDAEGLIGDGPHVDTTFAPWLEENLDRLIDSYRGPVLARIRQLLEATPLRVDDPLLLPHGFLRAFGSPRSEVRNTKLLAWVLSPHAGHDLAARAGAAVLGQLNLHDGGARRIVSAEAEVAKQVPSSLLPSGTTDPRIDVLLELDNQGVIVIEAKIDALERENQCADYEVLFGEKRWPEGASFVFLTLDGDEPTTDLWSNSRQSGTRGQGTPSGEASTTQQKRKWIPLSWAALGGLLAGVADEGESSAHHLLRIWLRDLAFEVLELRDVKPIHDIDLSTPLEQLQHLVRWLHERHEVRNRS